MDGKNKVKNASGNTAWLYKLGAAAAFIAVILFRRNLSAEFAVSNGFGLFTVPAQTPVNAQEWFALLQTDKCAGLILLNFFDVVNYLLVGILFIALYAALRKTQPRLALVALVVAVAGILLILMSNQALAMLSLSNHYAAAGTDAQRAELLIAGEARLAVDNPGLVPTGAGSLAGLFLMTLATLLFAAAMLRSPLFGKTAAWFGLLAGGTQLLYFPVLFLLPNWVALPFVLSAPFRVAWYVLSALRLLKIKK
jgi:hypothetical protein